MRESAKEKEARGEKKRYESEHYLKVRTYRLLSILLTKTK